MPDPKRLVRQRLRARRRELAAARDVTADAAALAEAGVALAAATDRGADGAATTVLCYESIPGEPPTEALNAALVAAGHRVLVPITRTDLDLDWHDVTDPGRTPLGLDAAGDADLVLAPGLAVDATGTRLGQGGGCYDRVLPRRRPGVRVVVLLHPGELSGPDDEPLPRDPHDVPVDAVLTADGVRDLH